MKNIIEDTIGKIKKENIRLQPRWKYLAKKYSAWTSFFLVALIGAAAFSVAYFIVSQLDWDLYRVMHRNPFFYFLSLLPHLWIILIVALAFFAFFNLRKTETGYRYDFSKIAITVLGILLFFGLSMFFLGFGGKLNSSFGRHFPGYEKLVMTKESQWSQPEKGFLAGTVNSVSENTIDLQDLSGKEWQVSFDENTTIRPSVNLEKGEMIKAIGREEKSQTFRSDEIRPWQGRGQTKGDRSKENGNSDGGRMNGRRK